MGKIPNFKGIFLVSFYVSLLSFTFYLVPAYTQPTGGWETSIDFSRSVVPIPPEVGSSVEEALGDTMFVTLTVTDQDENIYSDTEDTIKFCFEDDIGKVAGCDAGDPTFIIRVDAGGSAIDETINSTEEYLASPLAGILPNLHTLTLSETGKATGVFDEELNFAHGEINTADWQDLEVSMIYIGEDGLRETSCLIFRGNDGTFSVDKGFVKSGDTVTITVQDQDLNLNDDEVEEFESSVNSADPFILSIETEDDEIEGGNTTRTFTETGPDTGVFTASFLVGTDVEVTQKAGDEVLRATNILVTFNDEVDSTGKLGDEIEVNLPVATETGSIVVAPELVGPGTTVTMFIADLDLDQDPQETDYYGTTDPDGDNFFVSFKSEREEVGDGSPDLKETGPDSSVFEFQLELITDQEACQVALNGTEFEAAGGSEPSAGACPGDLISVKYEDEHDASGMPTTVSAIIEVKSFDPEFSSDKTRYAVGERVAVTIADPDANRDPDIADLLTDIRVTSDSDRVGQEISAIETGKNTGVFMVSFGTTSGTGGGAITVKSGDRVIVEYTDDFPADFEQDDKDFFHAIEFTDKVGTDITLDVGTPTPAVTASPAEGTYNTAQFITLTADKHCTIIYYTEDGSTPTETSSVYDAPILITKDTTLRFYGVDSFGNVGLVTRQLYNIDSGAPTAIASPTGGEFDTVQFVTLTASEPGTIYYTLNGDTPTTSSAVYSSPISITFDTTLKFMAKDAAGNAGPVSWEKYVINIDTDIIAPTVTATPPGGTYGVSQSVVLTADEPATIYYTTDGSTPTTFSRVYTGPTTIASDTTLKFFGRDTAGNSGTEQTQVYIIDINVRAELLINSNDEYTNDTLVALSIKCDNSTVRSSHCFDMRISTDGTLDTETFASYESSKSVTLPAGDETKIVVVQFRTEDGTVFGANDTIILDTRAPASPTITSLKDGDYVNKKSLVITGEAEHGSQIQVFDENTRITTTQAHSPWSARLEGLAEGSHMISATAEDRAGNISPLSSSIRIYVDTAPPTGSVIINNGDFETYSGTVNLSLKCSGEIAECSKMRISLDGTIDTELEEDYTAQKQIRLSDSDGPVAVYVQYVDAAGTKSPVFSDEISLVHYSLSIMTISNRSPVAGLDQVTVGGTVVAPDANDPIVRIEWGDGTTWARPTGGLWEDTHTYSPDKNGHMTILASLFDGQERPLEITDADEVVLIPPARPFPPEIVALIVGAPIAVAATVIALKKPEWIPGYRPPDIVFDYGIVPEQEKEIVVRKGEPEISYFSDIDGGKIAERINETLVAELRNEENMRRNLSYVKEAADIRQIRKVNRNKLASKISSEAVIRIFDNMVNNYFTSQFVKGMSYETEVLNKKRRRTDTTNDADKSRLRLEFKDRIVKLKQNIDTISVEPYIGVSLVYVESGKKIPIFRIAFKINSEVQIGGVEFAREDPDGKKIFRLKNIYFNLKPYISGLYVPPFNPLAEFDSGNNLLMAPIVLPNKDFEIEEISIRIG